MGLQQLLDHWPSVIAAQLLGVLLALVADYMSFRLRPSEFIVLTLNCVSLMLLWLFSWPLIFHFCPPLASASGVWGLLALPIPWLWLFLVAWVQAKHRKIPLRAAFCDAFGQLSFLAWVMCGVAMVMASLWPLPTDNFILIYSASAAICYALLSLFRPAIYRTWDDVRQSFKKNRPLR